MTALQRFAIVFFVTAAGLAQAQWGWRDASGRQIFSDQPPPASVPDKDILRQPTPPRLLTPVPAAEAPKAASAPRPVTQDKELEAKKKQADEAAAAQKKAADDKLAKDRADNCARAQQAKASYDSGARIARTNAQGEREIIDDATRVAESKRLETIIAADCK